MSNALYEWSKKKNPNDSIGKKVVKGVVKTGQYMLDNPSTIVGAQLGILGIGLGAAKVSNKIKDIKKTNLVKKEYRYVKGLSNSANAMKRVHNTYIEPSRNAYLGLDKKSNPMNQNVKAKNVITMNTKKVNPFPKFHAVGEEIKRDKIRTSYTKGIQQSIDRYASGQNKAPYLDGKPMNENLSKSKRFMGKVAKIGSKVTKYSPVGLVGLLMSPKPAGADSELYKVKGYKRK